MKRSSKRLVTHVVIGVLLGALAGAALPAVAQSPAPSAKGPLVLVLDGTPYERGVTHGRTLCVQELA